MSLKFYEKNVDLFKEQFKDEQFEKLKNREYDLEEDIDITIEHSRTWEKVFKVNKKGRSLFLTGKYNPTALIEKKLQEKKISFASKMFIVGMESCIQIRECLRQMQDKQTIIVYEPCINIFIKALEEIDFEEIIKSKQVMFIVNGINDEELDFTIKYVMDYEYLSFFTSFTSPNYTELFKNRVEKAEKIVADALRFIMIQWNTLERFTDVNAQNVLNNICSVTEIKTFTDLFNKLPEDFPTIVVSAGPSLDKNIDDLKAAVGKAFIVATDTAVKPCLRHGIKPDMLVIIDGKKEKKLFENEDLSDIPLLMTLEVPYGVADLQKGIKLLAYTNTPVLTDIIEKVNKNREEDNKVDLAVFSTGGSVAHEAFLSGIAAGSKTIILIGQDLAFTGNKSHATETTKDVMDKMGDLEKFPLVESVDGGMVRSRRDFIFYKEWFEGKIELLNGYRIIDATEGGAKIKGTEIMTLKDAIELSCNKEIDVKSIFKNLKDVFSDEEKIFIRNYLKDLVVKFEDLSERSFKGLRAYKKLEDISRYSDLKNNGIDKVFKDITKVNEYIENDVAARTTVDSLKDLEKIMRRNVYNVKEDQGEELRDIASHGKIMLTNINRKSKEIKELLENILDERGIK